MKRALLFLFVLLFLAAAIIFVFVQIKHKVGSDLSQSLTYPNATPSPTVFIGNTKVTASIFVPYWAVDGRRIPNTDFDTYIYFGILPNSTGIATNETGAIRLGDFVRSVPYGKSKLLALRMVDTQDDFSILEDQKLQKKVIDQTIAMAKQNRFDGVVVDLELSAIPFDSVIKQIDTFVSSFSASAKKSNLTFSLTLYGDTFYRLRPFDVKTIAQQTDSIMLMAYDFHKAKADPGPNFPLHGKDQYGYDLSEMIDDFLRFAPPQKLTVIFGMFGYDWMVDANDQATGEAEALPYEEIKSRFLTNCKYKNCLVQRDNTSTETQIRYIDDTGQHHIVWFEDADSVSAKEKYLQGRGIGNYSYWAYSYF